jgi:hypothetical protein
MAMTNDKKTKMIVQGLLVLSLVAIGYAAMQQMRVSDAEAATAQARKATDDANNSAAGTAMKLKAASDKLADVEKKQKEADSLKALLISVEPAVQQALEGAAKTAKPPAKATLLAGAGLIGQIAHGANTDAALATLDRALAADKGNCPAALGINLSAIKKAEAAPECQAFLPVPIAEAKLGAAAAAPAAAEPGAAPAPAAPAAAPDAKAPEAAKADAKK